jgi:amino acid transporter
MPSGSINPPPTPDDEDGLLRRFGYWPRFARTLGWGESFGVAFSFISVTTGIFTTFGFLLSTAGPRGIWTWPLAVAGQTLVAHVYGYGALAARIPVAGGPYQWASRLAGPLVGWWLGWLSLAFLVIVTVSVDYALVQAAVASGALGMLFLVALAQAIPHPDRISEQAPVAAILRDFLGGRIELFLAFICLAIYTCGTVIMTTASRLAWAMARDRRLPAHQLLARVPRATSGPVYAVLLVAGASALIVVTLGGNPDALTTLFTASTLLPAILYTGTVTLFLWTARRMPLIEQGSFRLGGWERLVATGALGWLGYELVVLLAPAQFRPAQGYALAAVALGAVVYILMRVAEPVAMTSQPATEEILTQDAASDQDTASFGEQASW